MSKYIGIFLALMLVGCEYSENDLDTGKGIYDCVSNNSRPSLTFDSKTLTINRINLVDMIYNSWVFEFLGFGNSNGSG